MRIRHVGVRLFYPLQRQARSARRARDAMTRLSVETLEERALLSTNLVASYAFDEGSGTTTGDASGNANTGTLSNASWSTAGKYGGAVAFNGSTSLVSANDSASLHLTTGMTLEAWVNPSTLQSPDLGWSAAISKVYTGPGNDISYALYAADGTGTGPAAHVFVNGIDYGAQANAVLPLNTWSFLTATYNGSTLSIYVNGQLAGTQAVSGSIKTSADPLDIGGDTSSEMFTGLIDNVRVYNAALTQAQIQTDMTAPVNGVTDTGPPTVSLTNPANGATVSGAITVTANASDDVSVANVQFQLDGTYLGAPVTSAPYSYSWDTTQVANGNHTITAVATDVGGNSTTSAPVQVTVSNSSGNASTQGQWSSVMNWSLIAINQVLLNNGKVLMWDGGPACIGSTSATIYDPTNGTFTPVPVPTGATTDNDIFCSGVSLLANGDVAVMGGHDCSGSTLGSDHINIFDPTTNKWTVGPTMAYFRWYPTATTLSDGRVLITAGSVNTNTDYVPVPEVYDPVANTVSKLSNASMSIPNYPFMFVLPNGNVLEAGSDEGDIPTQELNVAAQTWTMIDPNAVDGSSAVEYQPGKIMKSGASDPENASNSAPSAATTYVIDMSQSSPKWQQTAPMASARTWQNLTVLPDGTVLATGGGTDLGGVNPSNAVYTAESWSPTTQTWSTMASMQVPRLYHSTALLLPDGRVLVAGGGNNYVNNNNYPSAQIYSPPYLFNGARPTITSAPANLSYGSSFFVGTPDGASISSVALIRDGSVTHSVNMGQTFQNLTFQQTSGGLTVQSPANANLAQPGDYMLFIVNSKGVPSVASFVRFPGGSTDTQPPTAPSNLVATASSGSVSLTWGAATDNVGVTQYNVYRSTTSGFTPSSANLLGTSTTTTYVNSVAPGTYYYLVTAQDAAGNVGPASNQASATVASPGVREIQSATNGTESSVSQISVSFPSNVTPGNFLVVTGASSQPRESITITDSAGDTFVPALGPVSDTTQNATAYVWYAVNAKGGTDTVTLTPAAGSAMEIHVSEWSGINPASPVDQTSSATGTGATISSGSKTTTQNGDLIYGYAFAANSATAGTGFTPLSAINGDLDEYEVQGAAGSVAATFSQSSGSWLDLMVAFRAGSSDTQPPTAPTNLNATGALGSVSLTWTAATDNVGVTQYNIYRSTTSGFTPSSANRIGTSTTTGYTDNVAAGTYYYLVTAQDAAGNVGPPSNQATGTSQADTTPPTAPTNLVATGAIGKVSLSWTAATDNVGVTQYNIYRSTTSGFTPSSANLVGTTTTTSDTDTVAAGTYYYLVTAQDAAGNVGPPSNQATGTSSADTTPPTVNLTAPASGATVSGTVTVSATASDNVAVASVQFQLDGANLGSAIKTAPYTYAWNTTTATNGAHTLSAIATDTSGNQATTSITVTVSNTSGLVASYGFDEGSGTTTADASGNGNTGTLSGAVWSTAGKYGDALSFNGTNAVVAVNGSTSLNLTSGMTLEAWVNPNSLSNPALGWDAVVAKEHTNSNNDIAYALYAANGTGTPPAIHVLIGGIDYGVQGTSVLALKTWTFLAGTYDGHTLSMYVNGVLVGSMARTGNITVTTDPLKIGGDWSGEMFNGLIDNVRIYNKALTQSQIQTDMGAAVGGATGSAMTLQTSSQTGAIHHAPSSPGVITRPSPAGAIVVTSAHAAVVDHVLSQPGLLLLRTSAHATTHRRPVKGTTMIRVRTVVPSSPSLRIRPAQVVVVRHNHHRGAGPR